MGRCDGPRRPQANALYLIRPDTYVALADSAQSAEVVAQFFAKAGIKP